jgi:hypothetical protein
MPLLQSGFVLQLNLFFRLGSGGQLQLGSVDQLRLNTAWFG